MTEKLPIFYADTISGMVAGAYTSRVTLSLQGSGDGDTGPAAVLVMPTQALYSVAIHIVATLTGPENIAQMKGMHEVLAARLADPANAIKEYSELLNSEPVQSPKGS